MEFKKAFSFIFPKDFRFFPMFNQPADQLVNTSKVLIKQFRAGNIEKRVASVNSIRQTEQKGDIITINLFEELNGIFISHYAGKDFLEQNSTIDSAVDIIHATPERIHFHKLPLSPKEFVTEANCIHPATAEIQFKLYGSKAPCDFLQFKYSYKKKPGVVNPGQKISVCNLSWNFLIRERMPYN
jgi:hypothetical protein